MRHPQNDAMNFDVNSFIKFEMKNIAQNFIAN